MNLYAQIKQQKSDLTKGRGRTTNPNHVYSVIKTTHNHKLMILVSGNGNQLDLFDYEKFTSNSLTCKINNELNIQ